MENLQLQKSLSRACSSEGHHKLFRGRRKGQFLRGDPPNVVIKAWGSGPGVLASFPCASERQLGMRTSARNADLPRLISLPAAAPPKYQLRDVRRSARL